MTPAKNLIPTAKVILFFYIQFRFSTPKLIIIIMENEKIYIILTIVTENYSATEQNRKLISSGRWITMTFFFI